MVLCIQALIRKRYKKIELKGIMSPVEYFFKYTIKSVLSVPMVFKFIACLVHEENEYEVFSCLFDIFSSVQCALIVGFRNNFQGHRRVTEPLLETQAAIRKPEQVL